MSVWFYSLASLASLALAASVGCSGAKARDAASSSAGKTTDGAPSATSSTAGSPGEGAAAPKASLVDTLPAGQVTAPYGDRRIEVACNGIDDDGDGLVDVLVPAQPNVCHVAKQGACGTGYAACEKGQRVCHTPPPMPEVMDGIDNDCNGTVDDVPIVTSAVRPRALMVMPRYAWTDAAPDVANMSAMLAQAGISYDRQRVGTDWDESLDTLDQYSLAVIPGYLLGSVVKPKARAALEAFARNGGVVIVMKPVGTDAHPLSWKLAGLTSSKRRRDIGEIHFEGASSVAFASVDSPEERVLKINDRVTPDGVEVYDLVPDPTEKTEALAQGYAVGGARAGAVITRRPLGKGAIYAVGHDLATFAGARCYVNCFEPSGDVLRLFLEGALREATGGHYVVKHTVPGEASSVLLVTHDVDAPDAQNAGEWGDPGALQVARLESTNGVHATFDVTTDYVAGYFNPKMVKELCALGMCPLGAHGVRHPENFHKMAEGNCKVTRAQYGANETLCGEVTVSSQLLEELTGKAPRFWRSPYLLLHPTQFEVLARQGYSFDSTFGIGDMPYNLPVDLESTGAHQNRFHHRSLFEFPVSCEDGRNVVEKGQPRREELQASNASQFATLWDYVLLRNVQNRSMTTLLMHPSRGRGAPMDNIQTKLTVLDRLLKHAAEAHVTTRSIDEYGDFWRARLDARLDATFEPKTGYTGTLTVGNTTAPGLTLEFGDRIATFTCAECKKTRVQGNRVVIEEALPPNTKAEFVAR